MVMFVVFIRLLFLIVVYDFLGLLCYVVMLCFYHLILTCRYAMVIVARTLTKNIVRLAIDSKSIATLKLGVATL